MKSVTKKTQSSGTKVSMIKEWQICIKESDSKIKFVSQETKIKSPLDFFKQNSKYNNNANIKHVKTYKH